MYGERLICSIQIAIKYDMRYFVVLSAQWSIMYRNPRDLASLFGLDQLEKAAVRKWRVYIYSYVKVLWTLAVSFNVLCSASALADALALLTRYQCIFYHIYFSNIRLLNACKQNTTVENCQIDWWAPRPYGEIERDHSLNRFWRISLSTQTADITGRPIFGP